MINKVINLFLKYKIINIEDIDIYEYGLFVLFYNAFLIIDIIILSILFNKLNFTLLFLLFWIPYRILIGGSHCSTPFKCFIVFNLLYLFSIMLYSLNCIKLILLLNIIMFIIQLYFYKFKNIFYLLWILFFIINITTSRDVLLAINIAYFFNSFSSINKYILMHDCIL